jgi:hypothetical protein
VAPRIGSWLVEEHHGGRIAGEGAVGEGVDQVQGW